MPTSPLGDADTDQTQPNTVQLQATEQQLKARAEGVSIEDYLLPRSITLRLAKSVLPPNTSVQKDAVLAIQKAATVFVSYLSSHANEATLKRTVSPADVLNALSELEFEGFRPRLEKELDKFTDIKAAKRKPRKSGDGDGDTQTNADVGAESKNGVQAAKDCIGDAEMTEVVVRGAKAKRVKRDNVEGKVEMKDQDQDQDQDDDDDDGGEDGGNVDEMEGEHEEDADATEEEEDEEDEEEGRGEDEELDRVEDLDRDARARRFVDPDAAGDSDSDEEEPGSQLQGDLGLG